MFQKDYYIGVADGHRRTLQMIERNRYQTIKLFSKLEND